MQPWRPDERRSVRSVDWQPHRTFFGEFTKFLWETWLPDRLTWRRQQKVERERQLAFVRAPAILAFSDLHFRLKHVAETDAANYLYVRGIGEPDYYINSTAYLVARAFIWQEILRRRMAELDYAELYGRLEIMTTAFSRGSQGFQVFRLEQREIAERMIVTADEGQTCLPLSEFLDRTEDKTVPRWASELQERVTAALNTLGANYFAWRPWIRAWWASLASGFRASLAAGSRFRGNQRSRAPPKLAVMSTAGRRTSRQLSLTQLSAAARGGVSRIPRGLRKGDRLRPRERWQVRW